MSDVGKIVAIVISIVIFLVMIPVLSIMVNNQDQSINTDDLETSLINKGYPVTDLDIELWDEIIDNPYYFKLIISNDGDYHSTHYLDSRVYLNYDEIGGYLVDVFDGATVTKYDATFIFYNPTTSNPLTLTSLGLQSWETFMNNVETYVPLAGTTTPTEMILVVVVSLS